MEQKTTPKNTNEQEVDVVFLFSSVSNFLDKTGYNSFRAFKFLKKNYIITLLLLIAGVSWGVYSIQTDSKPFKHVLIVVPNFNSTTYLYNKIENFQAHNTSNYEKLHHISGIEISPVIDVVEFISDREQNLQIARYMSENTMEIHKYKKGEVSEKLYRYHKITYYTKVEDKDQSIYNAFVNELNNDAYFIERQKVERADTEKRLLEYQTSVNNINGLFEKLGNTSLETNKTVNVEMFSEMDRLLEKKNSLLEEINKTKVAIIEESKIIYDVTKKLNVYNKKGKLVVIFYPLLFIVFFLIIGWGIKQFRRYAAMVDTKKAA